MPDEAGLTLLRQAAETLKLSARGFHRVLRVAPDVGRSRWGGDGLGASHVAEALSYRGETLRSRTAA